LIEYLQEDVIWKHIDRDGWAIISASFSKLAGAVYAVPNAALLADSSLSSWAALSAAHPTTDVSIRTSESRKVADAERVAVGEFNVN
jgi:hypothetical protein